MKLNSSYQVIILAALAAVMLFCSACGTGRARIPGNPDDVITAGDDYFQRKKYIQAQETYRAFLQRYPGHERSDYAQYMLAESYYADEEWPLAAVEYRILVTNYGYSDYVDDGYLKEALSLHEQAPKPPLDQTPNYQALERLERFLQVFSASALVPQAEATATEIRLALAQKELDNAMFYLRNKRYDSALVYFDKIIDNYPNNEYWARALYEKGKILQMRGEDDEARRMYSKVLAYPDNIPEKKWARNALKDLGS